MKYIVAMNELEELRSGAATRQADAELFQQPKIKIHFAR
jgi:hypothetical protein